MVQQRWRRKSFMTLRNVLRPEESFIMKTLCFQFSVQGVRRGGDSIH